jgi:hypothetical protein
VGIRITLKWNSAKIKNSKMSIYSVWRCIKLLKSESSLLSQHSHAVAAILLVGKKVKSSVDANLCTNCTYILHHNCREYCRKIIFDLAVIKATETEVMCAKKCPRFNSFHIILSYYCLLKCYDTPETVEFDVVTSESGILCTCGHIATAL